MKRISGTVLSSGLVIGAAKRITAKPYAIDPKQISPESVELEYTRLLNAIDYLKKDTEQLINSNGFTKEDKEILGTQLYILDDPELKLSVKKNIQTGLMSLEQAIYKHFNEVIEWFGNLANEMMAQRASDYKDVGHRLLSHLLGREGDDDLGLTKGDIPLFRDITPTQVTRLRQIGIQAYCVTKSSYTAHSSIVARALGIAALMIPDLDDEKIEDGVSVILDGFVGEFICEPDQAILNEFEMNRKANLLNQEELNKLIHIETYTRMGKRIQLLTNIEFPLELDEVIRLEADGVGLFRTEFLYLGRQQLPDEEEQYLIYRDIAKRLAPKTIIIRTFDLGGDKLSHIVNVAKEDNPYLGCRGLRFSLRHLDLFKTQIRAILRANEWGNIKIMFPMVIGPEDMRLAKGITEECRKDLINEGHEDIKKIQMGAMIEIPSAALSSAALSKECHFFSIGTNDLVQYTLAVDRNNDEVAMYYYPYHPAVLNLIKMTVENAHKGNIPVGVCGEIASDPLYTDMLLSFGVDELSVNPNALLEVKKSILNFDIHNWERYRDFDTNQSLEAIRTFFYSGK